MDQFNFVAIRVSHKGNHSAATLDRASLARHVAASKLDLFASCVGIRHTQSDVPVSGAMVIVFCPPVVGQFYLGLTWVAAFKAQKRASQDTASFDS